MMDVAMFALGGLIGLALWRLLLGPLFHGFMHGLMRLPIRPGAAVHDEAPDGVIRS